MQSIGNITQPRTIEYEDGVYIGELLGNVPHGRGFLSFDEDASHGSAVYFGGFNQGEEEGFGTIFQNGSFSHGMYSRGVRIDDATLTDADVIDNLKRDMFTMCLLINHLNEDLNFEKDVVEQVNSSLYTSHRRFHALFQLAASTPGVDRDALNAI